ncbi:MAG: hypothetical protein ACLU99_12215 [Alphaproteobacteria bacterium]
MNMYLNPEYKYVCFTDDETYLKRRIVGPWHIEPLRYDRLDNTRNNRYHKMHPHELFSDYEESLFIDANIQLRGNCLLRPQTRCMAGTCFWQFRRIGGAAVFMTSWRNVSVLTRTMPRFWKNTGFFWKRKVIRGKWD